MPPMADALHDLVHIRGWLTDSLLAYLAWVERQEIELPHYFPTRLRERAGVMQAIWQRLQVRSHPELLRPDEGDEDGGDAAYAPRRRVDARESSVVTCEEIAERYPRAMVLGDPGAGKTWLLRFLARQSVAAAMRDLEELRIKGVNDVTWPVRIRLPELARSPGVAIEAALASFVREKAALGVGLLRQRRAPSGGPAGPPSQPQTPLDREVSPRLEAFAVEALRAGRALVLLDAWDEVPQALRADLDRRLHQFAEACPHARIVVTSRDVGGITSAALRSTVAPGDRPVDLELLAFGPNQVETFVAAWFHADPPTRTLAAARQALRVVLEAHPPMRELARNPLMLTFMCRLTEDGAGTLGAIQTRRVEMVDRALRGLLQAWPSEDRKAVEWHWPIDSDAKTAAHLELLAPVAFALVEAGQLGEVSELDLRAIVKQCHAGVLAQDPRHELRDDDATTLIDLWQQAGLLVPTGGGEVLFLHRTFQEYLAGIALVPAALVNAVSSHGERAAAVAQCAKSLAGRLRGSRPRRADWQEPIRLALGHIGLIRLRPEACGDVIRGVIEMAPGELGYAVAAMGEAVAEIASDPRARLVRAQDSSSRRSARPRTGAKTTREGVTDAFRKTIVETVRAAMRDEPRPSAASGRSPVGVLRWRPSRRKIAVTAKARAACGHALARLGDPRFRPDAWFLPDDVACGLAKSDADTLLGFVEVPAGPFTMGSDPAVDAEAFANEGNEQPQHTVRLDYDYYIARWPVTEAQFQAFCDDKEGNEGFESGDPKCLRGLANHPVGNVSWDEALRYSRWLTRKLRKWADTPEPLRTLLRETAGGAYRWQVTLASEAEWEKAARGGTPRIYPWGNEADPNLAYSGETGTMDTGAVGCFPRGASPYAVEDLAGNVMEWTRSEPRPYPYDASDGRESMDGSSDRPRVARGGCFYFGLSGGVRSAFRLDLAPGYRGYDVGFRVVVAPFPSDL